MKERAWVDEACPGGATSAGGVHLTLRIVDHLEKRGQGLNLTWEVRDGILYHSKGKKNLNAAGTSHWHTGSLPGTATIMIRRHDGRSLVALLNTRVSPSADHLGKAIEQLLLKAADEAFRQSSE